MATIKYESKSEKLLNKYKLFIMKPCTLIVMALVLAGCGQQALQEQPTQLTAKEKTMKISSADFQHNGKMPPSLTCDGQDASPELQISDVPKNAKSLALIMDDPDAPRGTWTHWVVFNIPPETTRIMKGDEPEGMQGITDFKRVGYGGPCPPSGTHRYFFRVYALDGSLSLKEGATKQQVLDAMQGKVVAQAELVGLYQRI